MMLFRKILIVVLVILAIGLHSAQAQDWDAVRGVVQNFLIQQLGRDAVLLEYNFEGATWDSSALGCPQEGQTYVDQSIAGYRWSFLMDDGIRYVLHSDLAGQQIILCQQASEPVLTFSTYNTNNFFSIQHPNLWTARPNGQTEVIFSFRGQDSCYLPTMRVLVVGNVTDTQTMLDTYLESTGSSGTFAPFGDTGLAVTHPAECGGVPHMRRATAIMGTTNSAFLIIQTAPTNVFQIWAPVFTEMLYSFVPGTGSLSGSGADVTSSGSTPEPVTAITAPDATPAEATAEVISETPSIEIASVPVAHVFVGDVYVGNLSELPGVGVTTDSSQTRTHLQTSVDGLQLAYIENGIQLYTVSMLNPESPNLLTDQVVAGFPPSWALDIPALAYPISVSDSELEIEMIFPDGTRETAGRVPFEGECAIESSYTVDQLYWQETGSVGNGLTFVWLSPDTFLYTPNCDGQGLVIFDSASDSLTEVGAGLRRAKISPDRKKIAAVSDDGLVTVDLTTLETQTIMTSRPPDQLSWDVTGTRIFYSSLFPAEPLIWNDADSQLRALDFLGVFPFESRLNTIGIFQIDPQVGDEALLWEGTGFAVGQIAGAPDGSGILFSLIPSDRGLLTNFANGADPKIIRNSVPETELYWLSINLAAENPPHAQLLAISSQPIFATPSTP